MPQVSLLFHDVYVAERRESGFTSLAADRYKLSVREFEEQLAGLTGEGVPTPRLTFDDGGASFYTIVADKLETRGIHAACFVTTGYIGRPGFLSVAQIRELDSRGHVIGSHSATHPFRFNLLSRDAMRHEWTASRQALEDIVGHAVISGSVPGGYFSRDVGRVAAESGIQLLFNSEPVRSAYEIDGCTIAGRFAIRGGAAPDFSQRLVQRAPWTRSLEWASWNAKSLVKPLLGWSYPLVADWIHGGAR